MLGEAKGLELGDTDDELKQRFDDLNRQQIHLTAILAVLVDVLAEQKILTPERFKGR